MSTWKLLFPDPDGNAHAVYKVGYTFALILVQLGPASKQELLHSYCEKTVSVAATM